MKIEPERLEKRSAEIGAQKHAENRGRNTTPNNEPREIVQSLFCFLLLEPPHAEGTEQYQDQTLSRIGEHEPEHRQIDGHHKRRRIDRAILGNAEIAHQHLERSERLGIVELDGDIGTDNLVAAGLVPLQITTVFTGFHDPGTESFLLRGDQPACKNDRPRRRLEAGLDAGAQLIDPQVQPERLEMGGLLFHQFRDLALEFLLLGSQSLKFVRKFLKQAPAGRSRLLR